MPPIKHARLSASSSHRWINCPGSVKLSEQFPPQPSNKYTEEGTAAHELGELKLRKFNEEGYSDQWDRQIDKFRKIDEYYCAEMEEATDLYAETVMDAVIEGGPGAELLIEQKFSLDKWVPESFGTSDAVVIADKTITVIDLKYGTGVKVDAVGNPQLRLYGLGAAELFSDLYDIEMVRTMIVQPRLGHVSTEEIRLKELIAWAEDEVTPRAQMAMEGTDYFAAGDWCRFCPAKAVCRARAQANLELARYEFSEPGLLSVDEIGDILSVGEHLSKWLADVKTYAEEQAKEGKTIKGYKLVEGRSIRKFTDETKVASTLIEAGIPEAAIYERKLYTLTGLEKVVGKKKLAELLGDLIVKPEGKPTLVPLSDPRKEKNAANDFAEVM